MIQRGWYDRDFIRDWSNGPLLVRADTGRLLTERDLGPGRRRAALRRLGHAGRARPVAYDAATGRYDGDAASLALEGEYRVATPQRRGRSAARPSSSTPRSAGSYPPEAVEATCWIPARAGRGGRAADLARAPGLLLRLERARAARQHHPDRARDVAALRADRQLRRAPAATCCSPPSPAAPITGEDLPGAKQLAPALGARRAPARAGALEQRHRPRVLRRDSGGHALPGARADRVRRQHAAGPRRRRSRAARRSRRWTSTPMPTCS